MARVFLKNVRLDYPILSTDKLSLKKSLFGISKFGKINLNNNVFVTAFENLNLSLSNNDKLSIIGPNGSGKTSLLRIIAGILEPTKGIVEVDGTIACVIEPNLALDPFASGLENVKAHAILKKVSKNKLKSYIEEVVEISELNSVINLPFHTYSSGMKMRLAFGIKVCQDADIWILDEWLSVTDANYKIKAEKILSEKISKSKILILSTHDKSLASKICNKSLEMMI